MHARRRLDREAPRKIESVIGNAAGRSARDEFGTLAAFVWKYEPVPRESPQPASTSPESVALSTDLKRRGWTFVGPTTVYAFMQAMGLVNDHARGCLVRPLVESARRAFQKP
jgi:DNA-3-methyladenine glycosylase I